MLAPAKENGLLEQPRLRVGRLPGPVHCAEGGVAGHVRLEREGWAGLLLGPSCMVHEGGEEPLVFVIRRCWSLWPRWSVVDADEELVGTVGGPWVLGRWDEPLLSAGRDGKFVTPAGVEMGHWDGRELAFAPGSAGEPFLRMLMLAAVLVR